MTQALYAHMNNKTIKKKAVITALVFFDLFCKQMGKLSLQVTVREAGFSPRALLFSALEVSISF
jgi:hypothetical protein